MAKTETLNEGSGLRSLSSREGGAARYEVQRECTAESDCFVQISCSCTAQQQHRFTRGNRRCAAMLLIRGQAERKKVTYTTTHILSLHTCPWLRSGGPSPNVSRSRTRTAAFLSTTSCTRGICTRAVCTTLSALLPTSHTMETAPLHCIRRCPLSSSHGRRHVVVRPARHFSISASSSIHSIKARCAPRTPTATPLTHQRAVRLTHAPPSEQWPGLGRSGPADEAVMAIVQ